MWNNWKSVLFIVQPATVIKWHRKGFKLYWKIKSKIGRPPIDYKIIALIQRMSRENSTWGVPHIKSELSLLGYDVAESTIAEYMIKHRKPPSQTWRTFLKNHMHNTVAIDFFVLPTITFRIFYVFILLQHNNRNLLHYNVTLNNTLKYYQ